MRYLRYIASIFDGGTPDALLAACEGELQKQFPGLAIEPVPGGTFGKCEDVEGPKEDECQAIREAIANLDLPDAL